MTMKKRTKRLILCIPATILLFLAIALFILLLTFDQLYLTLLAKNLALSPSSPVFKNWLKPTVPIYFTVYLFNLTNPDDVLAGGRPRLQEVGPFAYRETRERYDVQFGTGASINTVRFKHRIFYHFDRNRSLGDPIDFSIITPDLFYLGLLAQDMTVMGRGHGPFIRLSAQEVMWGYYPSTLNWLITLGLADDRKVGLFGKHNGTNINEFVINTGASNIQDIGKIYEVDGEKMMNVWDHAEANMINGTDGSLAPPGLDVGSTVSFHVPDICRSSTMYAVKRKPTVNRKDIEVVAFSGAPPDPTDPLAQWRSQMFCKVEQGCPPKGLVALEPCIASKGSSLPFFLSQPFFMGAVPSLREPFDGLPVPRPELHSTWVHIEPTTGFVLEAFKRIQFNVYMYNAESAFKNMSGPLYFPIGWLSEIAVADDEALSMLSDKVLGPRKKLPFVIAIVSAVVFLLALILYVILFTVMRRSVRGGKRNNVVAPVTSSSVCKDDSLESKLTPWTSKRDGDTAQAPEANPLLGNFGTDPEIPVV